MRLPKINDATVDLFSHSVAGEEPHRVFSANKTTSEVVGSPPHLADTPLILSEALRSLIFATYPALREERFADLMQHLLFPSNYNDWNRPIICACTHLAKIEDKQKLCRSRNYSALTLLEEFKKAVLPDFAWTGYKKKICRTAKYLGLDPDIEKALDSDLETPLSEISNPVIFTTGDSLTKRDLAKVRVYHKDLAEHYTVRASHEASKRVLFYMNGLPSNVFSATVKANLRAAYTYVRENLKGKPRAVSFRALRAINIQPQPFYQPSRTKNTIRVFSLNQSLTSTKKEIRKILTPTWTEFDLRSSQLAICAVQWNVSEVIDFLKRGGNIWDSLYDFLPAEERGISLVEIKPTLKKALYSVIFGMPEQYVRGDITKGIGDLIEQASALFIRHPIVAAMLDARHEQLERIKANKGAEDIFGKWIKMDKKRKGGERSVLSQLAQATELKLLLPVFDVAEERSDDFKIVLWQHDGFSVHWHHKHRKKRIAKHLQDAVQAEADKLGIPSELEMKDNLPVA